MKKAPEKDLLGRDQEEVMVTFLKKTKDGEFTEVGDVALNYTRISDFAEQDYEEEAYFFSYS